VFQVHRREDIAMKTSIAAAIVLGTLWTASSSAAPPRDDVRVIQVDNGRVRVVDEDGVQIIDKDGPVVVRVGPRRYIGARLIDVTEELRVHWGAPKDAGVLVAEIEKDGPAEKAGLRVGDIVTKADGSWVEGSMDLTRAVRDKEKDEKIDLEIVRGGKTQKLTVAVGERPGREREIEMGDLGREIGRDIGKDIRRGLRGHPWSWTWSGDLSDLRSLDDRLEELEKRLNEMEKKLPK
jgi:membrane-associated protease RseP (regulator of RpoE activity)